MSYGYSSRLIALNKKADKSNLGVQLGRACIKGDIPVCLVADTLGVSRQTLYNWFAGKSNPQKTIASLVAKYIKRITE
jgi:hypothetical protein